MHYFFGSQLLVAPVLTPADPRNEMATVQLWLPEGRWFDTARGCFEDGGRTIRRRYLLDEVPAFVRPGTLLPGQQVPNRLREGSYAHLVLTAYPGGDGSYRLYEDDGVSEDYRDDRLRVDSLPTTATRRGTPSYHRSRRRRVHRLSPRTHIGSALARHGAPARGARRRGKLPLELSPGRTTAGHMTATPAPPSSACPASTLPAPPSSPWRAIPFSRPSMPMA